jgi:hypothetical protein
MTKANHNYETVFVRVSPVTSTMYVLMEFVREPEGIFGSYARIDPSGKTTTPTRVDTPIETRIFELVYKADADVESDYEVVDGTAYDLRVSGPISMKLSFKNPMPPQNDLIQLAAEITRLEELLRVAVSPPPRRAFARFRAWIRGLLGR